MGGEGERSREKSRSVEGVCETHVVCSFSFSLPPLPLATISSLLSFCLVSLLSCVLLCCRVMYARVVSFSSSVRRYFFVLFFLLFFLFFSLTPFTVVSIVIRIRVRVGACRAHHIPPSPATTSSPDNSSLRPCPPCTHELSLFSFFLSSFSEKSGQSDPRINLLPKAKSNAAAAAAAAPNIATHCLDFAPHLSHQPVQRRMRSHMHCQRTNHPTCQ